VYLVFSAFNYSPVSLVTTTKGSVTIFSMYASAQYTYYHHQHKLITVYQILILFAKNILFYIFNVMTFKRANNPEITNEIGSN